MYSRGPEPSECAVCLSQEGLSYDVTDNSENVQNLEGSRGGWGPGGEAQNQSVS